MNYLMGMTGWHEFAEFVSADVGTVDSGGCGRDGRCLSVCVFVSCVWRGVCACVCVGGRASLPPLLPPSGIRVPGCVGGCKHTFRNTHPPTSLPHPTGLNSMVLASNNEAVLLPINEPTFGTKRKSQIQTFLEQNGGPGACVL